MPYSTITEFFALGANSEACERLGDDAVGTVIEALEAAKDLIDGALRAAGYDLPIPAGSVTRDIKQNECKLAAFELFAPNAEPNSEGFEVIKYRYESAMRWLGMVASKKIIPIPLNESGEAEDADESSDSGEAAIVSDTSRGWAL